LAIPQHSHTLCLTSCSPYDRYEQILRPAFPGTRQVEMITYAKLDYVGGTMTSASMALVSIEKSFAESPKLTPAKATIRLSECQFLLEIASSIISSWT
jgi:hypothetical protein